MTIKTISTIVTMAVICGIIFGFIVGRKTAPNPQPVDFYTWATTLK